MFSLSRIVHTWLNARMKTRHHYTMYYNKRWHWKNTHMEPSGLDHAGEHVVHLCLEFASSSCGLKWKHESHGPSRDFLHFLKSLIMWRLFKGTGARLACVNQCFDTCRVDFRARRCCKTPLAARLVWVEWQEKRLHRPSTASAWRTWLNRKRIALDTPALHWQRK